MPLTPKGEGGTEKTINVCKNVQILDLTYEDASTSNNSYPADRAARSMSDVIMDEAESIDRSSQAAYTTTTQRNTKFFNLTKDKYYNFQSIYVFIEKTDNQKIGRLHPLYVGHILHKKLNLKKVITSIDRIGINRVKVGLKSAKDANDLVNNKMLETENLRAFIPNNLLLRKGLIKGVDTYFNEEYLKENIECESNILEIMRLKRKTIIEGKASLVPRQLIVLTFEGNILPNQIIINSVIFPVEPFVQRVTQCFKCLRYGHVADQCRSTNSLCVNCGKNKTEDHTCQEIEIFCLFCKNSLHKTISRECPHYLKQQKIKKQMANSNMSFLEAKKYIESSFSTSVTTNNRFNVLDNLKEFPTLPEKITQNKNNSSNDRFLSQPKLPSTSIQHSSGFNKKRKIQSPSIPSP